MNNLSSEAKRMLNFLASAGPLANTTATRKDTHDILLYTGGNMLCSGKLYNINAEHLGAGIFRLTLKCR